MATNLGIDERLLATAQQIAGLRTKRETVNAALDEFIKRREQQGITSFFGTVDYDSDYDYKAERNR